MTTFLPMLFLFVDAKNNQWYRRLSERESQIQQFLNDPKYILPAIGLPVTIHSLLSKANLFSLSTISLALRPSVKILDLNGKHQYCEAW